MVSPICSTSRLGPLVRNGRMHTLMSNSRSAWARTGASTGTRSIIGTLETGMAAGATAAAAGLPAAAAPRQKAMTRGGGAGSPPLKARLGHQMNGKLTESNCKWASRYGLEAICASPDIKDPERLYPTVEELHQMLDLAGKHKLKVEIIDSPLLQSTYIDREKHAAIMLGQSPERDHEIEAIQTTIKNCASTGIRTLKYNLSILGVPRNPESVPGRGDTTYGKWNLKEGLAANLPL